MKLDAIDKGSEKKQTIRAGLLHVYKTTGILPPELEAEPVLHPVAAPVLEWFWEICATRTVMSAGMGASIAPLSYQEILAWSTLRKIDLPVWVVLAIRALDVIYMTQMNEVK